jgi:hypothetical protein
MSEPTTFPDWDTSNANTIALIAGHVTDGYANNEVPTAGETNTWMMLVGLWIRYLQSLADYRWHWWNPAFGSLLTHFVPNSSGFPSYVSSMGGTASTDPALCQSALMFPVGAIVTDIGFRVQGTAGPYELTVKLTKCKDNVSTDIVTQTVTPTTSWGDYIVTLPTPETLDDSSYYLEAKDDGGNNIRIGAVGVRVHQ